MTPWFSRCLLCVALSLPVWRGFFAACCAWLSRFLFGMAFLFAAMMPWLYRSHEAVAISLLFDRIV
jgi:hypothetical protein